MVMAFKNKISCKNIKLITNNALLLLMELYCLGCREGFFLYFLKQNAEPNINRK